MIIKSFEINKINFDQNKLILFYGKNEGFKNEATNNLLFNRTLRFIKAEPGFVETRSILKIKINANKTLVIDMHETNK